MPQLVVAGITALGHAGNVLFYFGTEEHPKQKICRGFCSADGNSPPDFTVFFKAHLIKIQEPLSVPQECSQKWQRLWAGNAQLLEGLVGPYPIEHQEAQKSSKEQPSDGGKVWKESHCTHSLTAPLPRSLGLTI